MIRRVLKDLREASSQVFRRASYAMLAGALTLFAFLLAVWLPNIGLIVDILTSSRAPLSDKLNLAISLLGSIRTNFSVLSASYTVIIAVLFGLNTAMIAYYLRRTRALLRGQEIAAGVGGIASGALGVGCAACGSFFLSAVLSSFGAAGTLAMLPLHGGEFGLLGVGLLLFSLIVIAKKIAAPAVCNPLQTP